MSFIAVSCPQAMDPAMDPALLRVVVAGQEFETAE